MPTQFALQLAADRQHEFEDRAAHRRLVHDLAITNGDTRRTDVVFRSLRRITTSVSAQYRRPVATTAAGQVRCCAA